MSAETDVGVLLLHAHDTVITPIIRSTGSWEAPEARWLRQAIHPGHTVVDCGANIGYFSALASQCVGSRGLVVALEPEAANLRLLRANLWRNGYDNVWIVPAAAADRRGLLSLHLNPDNTGDHQVHESGTPGDVLVPSLRLDDLLNELQVDVAKIDTQGADHLVMAGFAETLGRSPHAQVLVEFTPHGIEARDTDPETVLAGYRQLVRPLGILNDDGTVTPAPDDEILAAAAGPHRRWVNLVLGPTT